MRIKIAPAQLDADQPEFTKMLAMLSRDGIRTIVIEGDQRRALTLPQKVGIVALLARDVHVVTAKGAELMCEDDPAVALALAYGHFEKVRELRAHVSRLGAREARRRVVQEGWRRMAAAKRASALHPSL